MKVLIVDDEDLIRKALGRALVSKGHKVVEASNGEVGMKIWLKEKPQLVFLDILMPKLSGPELLKTIEDKNNAKVIMMSAYSGEKDELNFEELGVDLFIPKPFNNIFDVVQKAEELMP